MEIKNLTTVNRAGKYKIAISFYVMNIRKLKHLPVIGHDTDIACINSSIDNHHSHVYTGGILFYIILSSRKAVVMLNIFSQTKYLSCKILYKYCLLCDYEKHISGVSKIFSVFCLLCVLCL